MVIDRRGGWGVYQPNDGGRETEVGSGRRLEAGEMSVLSLLHRQYRLDHIGTNATVSLYPYTVCDYTT